MVTIRVEMDMSIKVLIMMIGDLCTWAIHECACIQGGPFNAYVPTTVPLLSLAI